MAHRKGLMANRQIIINCSTDSSRAPIEIYENTGDPVDISAMSSLTGGAAPQAVTLAVGTKTFAVDVGETD